MNRKKNGVYPLQIFFTSNTINDVCQFTFTNRVKIKYVCSRQLPTNAILSIWSDELGSSLSNLTGVKGINITSASSVGGSPSAIACYNAITLISSAPEMLFEKGWVVRNIYVRSSVTGNIYLNIAYDAFE